MKTVELKAYNKWNKNLLGWIKSRFELAEERISKLQVDQQRACNQNREKIEWEKINNLRESWDTNKHTTSTCNGSIRSKERRRKKNIWRSSSWNFSNLILKKVNPHIQEAQQTPSMKNTEIHTQTHYNKNAERQRENWQLARGKWLITFKGTPYINSSHLNRNYEDQKALGKHPKCWKKKA